MSIIDKLNKKFSLREMERTKQTKLGDALANYMAMDAVHKIDSQKMIGVDDTTNDVYEYFLNKTDFITKRQLAGRNISMYGDVFVCMLWKMDEYGDPFWDIDFFNIDRVHLLNRSVKYFKGSSIHGEPAHDGVSFKTIEIKKMENGEIAYFMKEQNDYKQPEATDWIVMPVWSIPGAVIRNNALSKPDWVNAGDMLYDINYFSGQLRHEWSKIKTQFLLNSNFTSGKKVSELEDDMIKKDKSFHYLGSSNNKFSAPITALINGNTTIDTLIRIIVVIKEFAMTLAFQGRDLDSTGTNKHNMQVSLFNQAHSEYNIVRRNQRNRDYAYFFKDIVSHILHDDYIEKNYIETNSDEDKIFVNEKAFELAQSVEAFVGLEPSIFDKGRAATLEVSRKENLVKQAEAALKKAQKEKTEKEKEFVGKETVKKEPPKKEKEKVVPK